MDLVAGATGLVGGRIARGLRERGRPVRALVRGGASRDEANTLSSAGVEVADADLTRRDSLTSACAGVDTVVCTVTSMPQCRDDGLRRVDLEGVLSLIDAAERAGARRFVYVSYSGNITAESPLATAKRACEDRLLAGNMEFAILRPSLFMEVWLGPLVGFDPMQGRVRIFGSGEAPVSFVSGLDVASFGVALATQPEAVRHKIEIGGPQALSQRQVVTIFERHLGRSMELETVPLAALEEQHRDAKDAVQKTFAALMLAYAQGDTIDNARESADRYGVKLQSVSDYARRLVGP